MAAINSQEGAMARMLVIAAVVLATVVSASEGQEHMRRKRALWNFAGMIKCATKRNALDYSFYGCYCGWGGKGTPVDALDTCCQVHDRCYDAIEWWCFPKLIDYNYRCSEGKLACGSRNTCGKKACACDKAAVECFVRTTFNKAYKNYKKSKC